MKSTADKHRTEREFNEGDLIYLRLQPYRQTSVGGRRPQKLSPLFYRPYQVVQRIEQVAYKLELPAESKIHPVSHVSQLKRKVGSSI